MKNNHRLSKKEAALFRESISGTRALLQDKVIHPPQRKKAHQITPKRLIQEQINASYYFSDEFQPVLDSEGPTRYLRPDVNHYEMKKLRRGDYTPEAFLDLHGLTQHQAKQELGALLVTCRREYIQCICIMHGHGKQILKQKIPLWLAQHPEVLVFHQATKEWGGTAALLVLIELSA